MEVAVVADEDAGGLAVRVAVVGDVGGDLGGDGGAGAEGALGLGVAREDAIAPVAEPGRVVQLLQPGAVVRTGVAAVVEGDGEALHGADELLVEDAGIGLGHDVDARRILAGIPHPVAVAVAPEELGIAAEGVESPRRQTHVRLGHPDPLDHVLERVPASRVGHLAGEVGVLVVEAIGIAEAKVAEGDVRDRIAEADRPVARLGLLPADHGAGVDPPGLVQQQIHVAANQNLRRLGSVLDVAVHGHPARLVGRDLVRRHLASREIGGQRVAQPRREVAVRAGGSPPRQEAAPLPGAVVGRRDEAVGRIELPLGAGAQLGQGAFHGRLGNEPGADGIAGDGRGALLGPRDHGQAKHHDHQDAQEAEGEEQGHAHLRRHRRGVRGWVSGDPFHGILLRVARVAMVGSTHAELVFHPGGYWPVNWAAGIWTVLRNVRPR